MNTVAVAASAAPMTAAALCRGNQCTPQCLLATNPVSSCDGCACNGEHHGKLADTPVPDTRVSPRPERVDEPALFTITSPEPEVA